MEFFTTRIRDKTIQTLKETGLFSSVIPSEKTGDKGTPTDLKLQIYLRAMAGKNCLWGIEVYD
jgi:hypothetical protein